MTDKDESIFSNDAAQFKEIVAATNRKLFMEDAEESDMVNGGSASIRSDQMDRGDMQVTDRGQSRKPGLMNTTSDQRKNYIVGSAASNQLLTSANAEERKNNHGLLAQKKSCSPSCKGMQGSFLKGRDSTPENDQDGQDDVYMSGVSHTVSEDEDHEAEGAGANADLDEQQ